MPQFQTGVNLFRRRYAYQPSRRSTDPASELPASVMRLRVVNHNPIALRVADRLLSVGPPFGDSVR